MYDNYNITEDYSIDPDLKESLISNARDSLKFFLTTPYKIKEILSVSDWADTHRVIESGSPFLGPWYSSRTPYLIEVMNQFSLNNSTDLVILMSSSQIGKTAGVLENAMLYCIAYDPSDMLFVSATEDSVKQTIQGRFEQALVSSGLQKKLTFSETQQRMNLQNKRSANKIYEKHFGTGVLYSVGAQSAVKLRSKSVKYLFMDEVDAFPFDIGGEGDPVNLALQRTSAYTNRGKTLMVSTPLDAKTSRIYKYYLRGDQRKYYVPCKYCGEYQELHFEHYDNKKGGLVFDRKEKGIPILDSIRYECSFCGKYWEEHDKIDFLQNGKWKATAEPEFPNCKSYSISSLYAPTAMYPWSKLVKNFYDLKGNARDYRFFVNNKLGNPWINKGMKKININMDNKKSHYIKGTIPDDVKFLTFAIDIHKKHLDIEVLGWGFNQNTYSIDWRQIKPDLKNNYDHISDIEWEQVFSLLQGYKKRIPILGGAIDTGWRDPEQVSSVIYDYCNRMNDLLFNKKLIVYPIKGVSPFQTPTTFKRGNPFYLRKAMVANLLRIDITTDYYKDLFAKYSGVTEKGELGYCSFPEDYSQNYYIQLQNEEKVEKINKYGEVIGYTWQRKTKDSVNHALDLRIYNMCVCDVFVYKYSHEIEKKIGRAFTYNDFYHLASKNYIKK